MAILTCDNLTLGYERTPVVEGLTFSINAGDYLCIVGENGSGKSTLMKTILHLHPPLSGKIFLEDGLRPNHIGYLPQQTAVQKDFPASVKEVVISGCLNHHRFRPIYCKKDKVLAVANMEKMGITHLADKCYRELSGGQQQRVLLARALCSTRRMLLLDEPVAGLDPVVTSDLYELIAKLNREDHITVIMISHDIGAATKYASHILHIGHEPLFFGTTADYLQSGIGRVFTQGGGTT